MNFVNLMDTDISFLMYMLPAGKDIHGKYGSSVTAINLKKILLMCYGEIFAQNSLWKLEVFP